MYLGVIVLYQIFCTSISFICILILSFFTLIPWFVFSTNTIWKKRKRKEIYLNWVGNLSQTIQQRKIVPNGKSHDSQWAHLTSRASGPHKILPLGPLGSATEKPISPPKWAYYISKFQLASLTSLLGPISCTRLLFAFLNKDSNYQVPEIRVVGLNGIIMWA